MPGRKKSRERTFHELVIEHLTKGVPAARGRFRAKTGRFLAANGGWAVTNQNVILPLALLYTADAPGNRMRGRKDILKLASRGGDALRDWQDRDGRVVFIKIDGSRWGNYYDPWSMYHWLETFALLRDHLDAKRRRRWRKGLRLAYAGIAEEQARNTRVHNIPTWHVMALVRAGQVFGVPEWVQLGTGKILNAARHQHPDGYWPEGAGPSTSYNRVYVHALGL